jgi:hypothetical protein
MDGGAVIVVLGAFSLAVLSLRNCCQVIYHYVSSLEGAIQLLSFQKLEEIPPGVRHVFGD